MILPVIALTALVLVHTANSQEKKEPWPGVTVKVLINNGHVEVSELTWDPGAVADWHSYPQYTAYAVTDVKMQEEIKGRQNTAGPKAGLAMWSPAVAHKTTLLKIKT